MEIQNQQPNAWEQSQPPPPAPSAHSVSPSPPKRNLLLPAGIVVLVVILVAGIALLYNHGTQAPKQQNSTSATNSIAASQPAASNSAVQSGTDFLPESEAVKILGQQGNYSTKAMTNQTDISLYLSSLRFKGNATVNAIYLTYLNSSTNSSVKLLAFKVVSKESGAIYASYLNSPSNTGGLASNYRGMSYITSSLRSITVVVAYAGDSLVGAYVLGNPALNQTLLLSALASYTGANLTSQQPVQNVTLASCSSLNISVTAPNASSTGDCSWTGGNLTLVSNFAPSGSGSYTLFNASGGLMAFSTLPLSSFNSSYSKSCVSTKSLGHLPAGNYILRLTLANLNESCGATYLKLESS